MTDTTSTQDEDLYSLDQDNEEELYTQDDYSIEHFLLNFYDLTVQDLENSVYKYRRLVDIPHSLGYAQEKNDAFKLAIGELFVWQETEEGSDYWKRMDLRLNRYLDRFQTRFGRGTEMPFYSKKSLYPKEPPKIEEEILEEFKEKLASDASEFKEDLI